MGSEGNVFAALENGNWKASEMNVRGRLVTFFVFLFAFGFVYIFFQNK